MILICTLLFGCRERDLSFEREFSQIADSSNVAQDEHQTKVKNGLETLINSNFPPRHFLLDNYEQVSANGLSTTKYIYNAYQFCWKAPTEQCTAPPRYVESPHQFTYPVQSELIVQLNLEDSVLPFPKTVTLYEYTDDLQLIEIPFEDLGNYRYSFYTSDVPRTIQYLFKLTFEEPEIIGQGFYTFKITGQ
jgi:hypothetical protein